MVNKDYEKNLNSLIDIHTHVDGTYRLSLHLITP